MRARNLINNNLYYCTPKEKDINFIMYPSKTYLKLYNNFDDETEEKTCYFKADTFHMDLDDIKYFIKRLK
jgi:hypothetical protein